MKKCFYPFIVESKTNKYEVNCGRCPYCRQRHIKGWIFRLEQEQMRSENAYFVTLTYNNKNLERTESNLPTLNHEHVKNFLKKLRKNNKYTIKYYCVGEYGTRTNRPHYHMILFNVSKAYEYDKKQKCKILYSEQERIAKHWNKGFIHIDAVNENTIAYTLKYLDKPSNTFRDNDDRKSKYAAMSNGLGDNYLSNETIKKHKGDIKRMYILDRGGIKIPIPRYYRNKIFNDEEKKLQVEYAKQSTEKKIKNLRKKFYKLYKNKSEEDFLKYQESIKLQSWKKLYYNQKKRKKI